MARMTKLQIDHLDCKLQTKIKALISALPETAQIARLEKEICQLKKEGLLEAIARLPKSKACCFLVAAVKQKGSRWSPSYVELFSRIEKTKEYREVVTTPVKRLETKIRKLKDAQQPKIDLIRQEATKVKDQAIFAGSSDEVLAIVESFLTK